MPENQQQPTFLCPVCDVPVPLGSARCPNVNCKEDLSSFIPLDTSGDAYYRRALNLIKQNHAPPSEAIDLMHNAASLEPGNVDVWVVLGKLYAQSKDYSSAESCWNRALLLQSEEPRAKAGLTRLKRMKQQDLLVSWAIPGVLTLLLVWFGIRSFSAPTRDVAQAFADNPVLAAYDLQVEQEGNSVRLIGSLPGETEKKLVMAAAQMALPGVALDASGLVLAPVASTPAPIPATPTVILPTATGVPSAIPTLIATAAPESCQVTTGLSSGTVYLRSGEGRQFEAIGILGEGTIFLITGESNDQGWIPVQTAEGLAGWIYAGFCK